MALPQSKRVLAGMSLLLSTLGLVVVLTVVAIPQSWLSRAWTGVTTDVEVLRQRWGLKVTGRKLPQTVRSQELFEELVKAYPKAELQKISVPEVGLAGRVYFAYDQDLNKSFVFSRIEALPLPDGENKARLWLVQKNSAEYLPAGIAEFVEENDKIVAYSIFTKEGNLPELYKQLVLSYDPLSVGIPQGVALILNF